MCKNNRGVLALQTIAVTNQDTSGNTVTVGKATVFRTSSGMLYATVQMTCPYLLWSPKTDSSGVDTNSFLLLSYVLNGQAGTAVSSLVGAVAEACCEWVARKRHGWGRKNAAGAGPSCHLQCSQDRASNANYLVR